MFEGSPIRSGSHAHSESTLETDWAQSNVSMAMQYYVGPKEHSRSHNPLVNLRGCFKTMLAYLRGITYRTTNSSQKASMRMFLNAIIAEISAGTSWPLRRPHPASPGSCRYRHSLTLCLLLRHLRHLRLQSPIRWLTSLSCSLPRKGLICK